MRIAAMVKNDRGDLLPYSCQSTIDQCEEWAQKFWPNGLWDRLKIKGCVIVPVEVTEITTNDPRVTGEGARDSV